MESLLHYVNFDLVSEVSQIDTAGPYIEIEFRFSCGIVKSMTFTDVSSFDEFVLRCRDFFSNEE